MKLLFCLFALPDKVADALAYGPGKMQSWCEESLQVMFEGDFDGGAWSRDVARLFDCHAEDAAHIRCASAQILPDAPAGLAILRRTLDRFPPLSGLRDFRPALADEIARAETEGGAK